MTDDNTTSSIVGVPQLVVCAFVGFFILRWFLNSSDSSGATSSGISSSSRIRQARRVTPEMIEVIQAMFPQVSSAAIRHELERNGGSVEATTEKILAEGTLREPPPSASTSTSHLNTPISQTPNRRQSPIPGPGARRTPQPSSFVSASSSNNIHNDLISRYNLQSRLKTFSIEERPLEPSTKGKGPATKNDKASLMVRARERRDLMILEARKKMEASIAKEK